MRTAGSLVYVVVCYNRRSTYKKTSKLTSMYVSLRIMIYFLFSYLQVLSEHVSNGLRDQGFPHTAATQNLFRLIDKFFDCLNVSNVLQGVKSRKEALHPYRDPNDWRL